MIGMLFSFFNSFLLLLNTIVINISLISLKNNLFEYSFKVSFQKTKILFIFKRHIGDKREQKIA